MAKKSKAKNTRASSLVKLVVYLLVVCVAGYLCLNGFGQGFMIKYMKPWT